MMSQITILLCSSMAMPGLTFSPDIYWTSSEASAGSTVMVAGAFGVNSTPTAYSCGVDASCASPVLLPALLAHESSIAFAYPDPCATGPHNVKGCFFKVCVEGSCTLLGDPNAPDVWWAQPYPPAEGTTFSPGPRSPMGDGIVYVNAGTGVGTSILRVFGRNLAFRVSGHPNGDLECVPAGSRSAAPGTTLILDGTLLPIAAFDATCYEASFDLSAIAMSNMSFPYATLINQFGISRLPLATYMASVPNPLTVIDVDGGVAGGNITLALASAAATSGDKLVLLGPHVYALTTSLVVPNNTVIAGVAGSMLSFSLPVSSGGGGSATPAITGGSNWGLTDLGIELTVAPAGSAAVYVPSSSSNFTALRVNLTLLQANVSSSFTIMGHSWEVSHSIIQQSGECLWPPTSESTNFLESAAFRLEGSTDGFFRNNVLLWKCAAFVLDCSQRIVWTDNNISCTDAGQIPHGNSISSYSQTSGTPYSQSYMYAHNVQTRPVNNSRGNWAFHESLTTDGPGGWGGGMLVAAAGAVITVNGLGGSANASGASAVVISGPGVGQWRPVVTRLNATSVQLSSPFDGHVVPNASIVMVLGTVGGKIVADNQFAWGSVVQAFGTTLTGVFASNSFNDQNNAGADSGAVDGALTGFGLCYGGELGPQPLFFVEYVGNTMNNSNGISLHDQTPNKACNATWEGPFIKFVALRGNTIGGIAASNPGVCGSINATNALTSDLLVEGNAFDCPSGNLLPCGNGVCVDASSSVITS